MTLAEFRNEPFTDFSKPENAAAMERALAEVRAQLGRTYPLIIGGEKITTEKTIETPQGETTVTTEKTIEKSGENPPPVPANP